MLEIAFVGRGQGITLMPSALRQLVPASIVLRPLVEKVEVVTTAAAWNSASANPTLALALDTLRAKANRSSSNGCHDRISPGAAPGAR